MRVPMLDRKLTDRTMKPVPMETLMDRAVDRMWKTIQRFDGRPVLYRQGSLAVSVTAVFDSVSEEAREALKVSLTRTLAKAGILESEMRVNGESVIPRAGDILEETGQTGKILWQVINSPEGRAWDWEDSSRKVYTLYMQEIGKTE